MLSHDNVKKLCGYVHKNLPYLDEIVNFKCYPLKYLRKTLYSYNINILGGGGVMYLVCFI